MKSLTLVAALLCVSLASCVEPPPVAYDEPAGSGAGSPGGGSSGGGSGSGSGSGGGQHEPSAGGISIDAVNGDGTADTVEGHAANHARRALIITGSGLANAEVLLEQNGVERALQILDSTDTMIRAELPADTQAGPSKMTVKHGAAAMEREVTLLQGEQGEAGPQGIQGEQGLTGIQGPAGQDGAQGPAGPLGPTGATGATGLTGAQGVAGPAGAVGPAGARGAAGPQGPAGVDAVASLDVFDTGVVGAATVFVNSGSWFSVGGTHAVTVTAPVDLLVFVDAEASAITPSDSYGLLNLRVDGLATPVSAQDFYITAGEGGSRGHRTFFAVIRNVQAGNHNLELIAKCAGPGVFGPCGNMSLLPSRNRVTVLQLNR